MGRVITNNVSNIGMNIRRFLARMVDDVCVKMSALNCNNYSRTTVWIVNSFLDNFFKGNHSILHRCQISQ